MKSRCTLVLSTLFLCFTISIAQTGGKTSSPAASTLSGGINLRSIAGAPFSADVVKESTQVLADGTLARHETKGKMFRDSLGRTRSETALESAIAGVEPKCYVTIVDPLQQISIVLDVAAKKATIFHLPSPSAVTARDLKLVKAAQTAGQGGGTSATENLGAMTIEGFAVTGSRRAHANEASVAKDRFHSAVTESWFSPELKIELLATTQAAQSTTRTTRLMNIVPGEPDPALFQSPADYATQESSRQK